MIKNLTGAIIFLAWIVPDLLDQISLLQAIAILVLIADLTLAFSFASAYN